MIEHRHRGGPVAEVREEGETLRVYFMDEPAQAADRRMLEREVSDREGAGHRDEELDRVGHHDAPESGHRGEEDRDRRGEEQGALHGPAEDDVADLGGGQIHGRHDDAVEEEAEIDGAETAHEGGRLAGIPDLVELEIGEDA